MQKLSLTLLALTSRSFSSAQPADLMAQMLGKAQFLNLGQGSATPYASYKAGFSMRFERGNVYWTHRTGVYAVQGRFRHAWDDQYSEYGALGYPASDEQPCKGTVNLYQAFEGGQLVFNTTTHEMRTYLRRFRKQSEGHCSASTRPAKVSRPPSS